jgi:hypothetical protein
MQGMGLFRKRRTPQGPAEPSPRILATGADGAIRVVDVPGAEASARLLDLRRAAPPWPVIVGDADGQQLLLDLFEEDNRSVDAIVRAASTIDVNDVLRERRADNEPEDDDEGWDVLGEWPTDARPSDRLHVPTGLSGKPLTSLSIALLPIDESWQAAAALRFGGWNECPGPEIHVALHRSWFERFGAEVACVTGDTVEMTVRRPPTTRDAALALAWEHYAYCNDIVDQGTGSVSALAASLLDSGFWFFWWD